MVAKQIENPSISDEFQKVAHDKVLAAAESSETLQRLISGKRETITIDVDGIPVEMYKPTPRQLLPLQKVTVEVLKIKAEAETEGVEERDKLRSIVDGFDSLRELCDISDQLLADLTVDPLLTTEAFSSGLIPDHYKAKLLHVIQKVSSEESEKCSKIENFRKDRKRSGIV